MEDHSQSKLPEGKKIYFASDFHLGVPTPEKSLEREKLIVSWLREIREDAAEVFLVGDLFDFWFEYKRAVPRGFTRVIAEIAHTVDAGIPVHIFTGNHDMWIFNYLPEETGAKIYREPIQRIWNDSKFFIGHGDGLGPGDHGYKFIKKVFASRFCQWLFARFHPNFGIGLANFWSGKSRDVNREQDKKFLGEENEWLAIYSKEILQNEHFDYFIFGHRHMMLDIQLNERSRYINLGDWFEDRSYAVFDGKDLKLTRYQPSQLV
ncbi:MAG: UDP-2,3-diacylglucosamine diphosphatase [Flavobacteriales bacterium]|nr:UDP-2,3-diacylglucosamine diphosphatase [Flavobacteriales bacterium]